MTTPPPGRTPSETSSTSLAALVDPDDWRLYHLMRGLPDEDRARVIAFAELLSSLRLARTRAAGAPTDDPSSRAEQETSRSEAEASAELHRGAESGLIA